MLPKDKTGWQRVWTLKLIRINPTMVWIRSSPKTKAVFPQVPWILLMNFDEDCLTGLRNILNGDSHLISKGHSQSVYMDKASRLVSSLRPTFSFLLWLRLSATTINFLNIRTPKQFVLITLKFELCGSAIE